MTAEQFAYWLQGRMELLPNQLPSEAEWKMIREHLNTVFYKVTPSLTFPSKPFMPTPYVSTTGDKLTLVC